MLWCAALGGVEIQKEMPGNKFYKVSRIVGHREGEKGPEYLVRWENYSTSSDSWEPLENLKNCDEYIAEYMDKIYSKSVRRSKRLHPTEDVEAVLSSDDELQTPSKPKKRISSKKPAKSATKTKTKNKRKSVAVTSLETKQEEPPQTYALRSMSNLDLDMSSDEEIEVSVVSVKEDRSQKKPAARRGLSETRFRKQLGNFGKIVSSTPYTSTSQVEKGAHDDLKLRSVQERTTTITEIKTVMTEAQPGDTIAQADSDSEEQALAQKEGTFPGKSSDDMDSPPSWMIVGWKEIALASVLTGIGVIGYICYATDYCSYC